MQESYRKGVANHPDPEPCECAGNSGLEALDRGICRLGIPNGELRKPQIRVPTASRCTEGNTAVRDKRKCIAGPAESKTPRMHRNFTRENREAPLPSVAERA